MTPTPDRLRQPQTEADPLTADAPQLRVAALAIAGVRRRGEHSNACPVVHQATGVETCDCWVIKNARRDAELALQAATPAPLDVERLAHALNIGLKRDWWQNDLGHGDLPYLAEEIAAEYAALATSSETGTVTE